VIFTGRHEDVPSLLAAADVAVQCSLVENLGGTIEALLMERPVVATRAGGMPESVRDGETGLLVPPSDPEALAAAILRLLENRDEGAALGRAGRQLMLERFTFARMVDDIDAVYGRLSRGAAAGAAS
jgi:glycosyltransferase involved in cell wall biosynthesis